MTPVNPSAIRREIRLALAGIVFLLAAFDLLTRAVPALSAHLSTIVAATFLYFPLLLLPRKGPGLEAYGLTMKRFASGLFTGLVVAAVFLPFFLVGQHVWVTHAEGRHFDFSPEAYRQLPERLESGRVPEPSSAPTLFKRGDRIEVIWAPTGPWRLHLASDGEFTTPGGRTVEPATFERSGHAGIPVHVALHVRGGSHLTARFTVDDLVLPAEDIRIAGRRTPPEGWIGRDGRSLHVPLSLAWIPLLVLAHLLIVALPEELFFRGYLQKRLGESGIRSSWRIAGVELTMANVIASITFALCHFVIGWDPVRLAVFFPSLIFGILRQRTDGIAAPVVCHALFNLMVVFTSIHYLPGQA